MGSTSKSEAAPFSRLRLFLWLASLVLVAIGVRWVFVEHVTPDMQQHFLPWYERMANDGTILGLRRSFEIYPPAYFYLLMMATYVGDAVTPIAAVKGVAWVFDFAVAALMYGLVRTRGGHGLAMLGAACVLLAPTVVTNSAYWGQCDVIYTTFLLACVYFLVLKRPVTAMLCFSVAFSFKLQSVFLAPLLLGLVLRRQIPWQCVVLPPAVYVASALPCAIVGIPWSDLLGIYMKQTGYFSRFLTLAAPSMFALLPEGTNPSIAWVGVVAAALFALCLAFAVRASRRPLDASLLVEGATLCVAAVPFLLPRMHERYFYPADVLSIALAFYKPRLWFVPIAFQFTSFVAYGPYLYGHAVLPMRVAAGVNLAVIGALVWSWLRDLPLQSVEV